MATSIIQKDGSKTPVSDELLRKLVKAGRIPPDTRLVVDGKERTTAEVPELAEIYKSLGITAAPAVAVPPQVGEEPVQTPAAAAVPAPTPAAPAASAADPELAEIRVAALRTINEKFSAAAAVGCGLSVVGIFGPLVIHGIFTSEINVESFAGWLHCDGLLAFYYLLSALVVILFWGVFCLVRGAALAHEEASLRQERYLAKLAKAVKVKTNK